jgi:hypothetical protein
MGNLSEKAIELKQCLDTISAKKRLLRALQRQLAQYQSDCEQLGAVDYSKPKFKDSENTSTEERRAIRIEEYRNKISFLMDEIFECEDKISAEISVLNECEQAMIIDRYIHNWSWKKICKEYNYAYDDKHNSAYNLIKRALNKIK